MRVVIIDVVVEFADGSIADDDHIEAKLGQVWRCVGVVSSLLTTEDSTKVSDEDEYDFSFRPKALQFNSVVLSVEDFDVGVVKHCHVPNC